jgi:hypothetical protein
MSVPSLSVLRVLNPKRPTYRVADECDDEPSVRDSTACGIRAEEQSDRLVLAD